MTGATDTPVRNKFRLGAKIIEWSAALSIAAIIIENLGFIKNISSVVAIPARKATNVLPNLAEIVANVPFPNFITQTFANTKMAQDFNLLLNLVALWAVARIIATIFKLMGAERGKAENIFSFVIKGAILLALLSEAVKFAMGSETIDLFKGLIPLSMNNGGDVPGWLSSNNLRELAWVISSSITGLLVGVWAYRSHIRPGRLMRQEAALQEVYEQEVPEEPEEIDEPEVTDTPEASEELDEPEEINEPEVTDTPEASETTETAEVQEVADTPETSETDETAEASEEPGTDAASEEPETEEAPEEHH